MKISRTVVILASTLVLSFVPCYGNHHNDHDRRTSVTPTTEDVENSSVIPDVMHDSGYYSNYNRNVSIGSSIAGIVLFVLICYCCFKCCCSGSQVVSQGIVIPHQPPPDPYQPNIVIQHIQQPQPPAIVQQFNPLSPPPPMVQHAHAPPAFQQQQPPFQGYPNQMPLQQQEWNPHDPIQPYAGPDYASNPSYNPSAPPGYGKY